MIEQHKLKRLFFKLIVIIIESSCDLFRKEILSRAAVLSFQTLFSVVPLLYLGMYILSFLFQIPNYNSILMLLSKYFIPEVAQRLAHYILLILSKIDMSSLGISGILFLIVITIFMGLTLERSVNSIWNSSEEVSKKEYIYKIIGICITPFIIFVPFYYSYKWIGFAFSIVNRTIMFFSLCTVLTLMYVVLPKAKVKLTSAVVGALGASTLYELTKAGFSFYFRLITGPLYHKIYGAIYFIPACMLWLYLSWIIFLLGVNISYRWQET